MVAFIIIAVIASPIIIPIVVAIGSAISEERFMKEVGIK